MSDPIAEALQAILDQRTKEGHVDTSGAVEAAKQQYPRFNNLPLSLSVGVGPGFSETYFPDDPENPQPGKLNVQLRDPKAIKNKSQWPDDVSLEAIHGLQDTDPKYQKFTQSFVHSMTREQMAAARHAYERDKKEFGTTESFQKWLPRVQAQEYIRGMLFTKAIPNWVGPEGEGQYTPAQMNLGAQIERYLKSSH